MAASAIWRQSILLLALLAAPGLGVSNDRSEHSESIRAGLQPHAVHGVVSISAEGELKFKHVGSAAQWEELKGRAMGCAWCPYVLAWESINCLASMGGA